MHNVKMDPHISVIVPVLNEAFFINETIGHLRHHNPSSRFEVIVADGDPLGTTLSALAHNSVKKVLAPKGRGAQMNAGAALATGKILLFLHADTLLDPGALEKITMAYRHHNLTAGAFELAVRSRRKILRIIEAGVRLRSQVTQIPYGDQAIFIARSFFNRVGGYPEIPIMEDVALMRLVKNKGGKILFLKARAFTSSRRWEKEGVLYCTLRNWALILLYGCGFPTPAPPTVLAEYRSPSSPHRPSPCLSHARTAWGWSPRLPSSS